MVESPAALFLNEEDKDKICISENHEIKKSVPVPLV